MNINEVASLPFERFKAGFDGVSIPDIIAEVKKHFGLEVRPGKRDDTLRAAYDAVQALASGAEKPPTVNPTAPVVATPTGAGGARYRVRSRDPRGRRRDGRSFGHAFEEVPGAELTKAMFDDPGLDIREIK